MFDLEKIGKGLPVLDIVGDIPDTGPLVVEAPPGTGKTTLIPPAVANKFGATIVTAPRRVAVRNAAKRLEELSGQQIGYSIKGEHRKGTDVQFMTPGVLLNRLLTDPELSGINAIIIDEVHERQLDTDLCLAMALELSVLRDDLFLCAMSATLNAKRFADYLGGSILSAQAEIHPVDISYRPLGGRIAGTSDFYRELAKLADSPERTLVFVPGKREVDQVVAELPDAAPLHGRLSSSEQDRAFSAHTIVATSIAESSITVPGIHRVVDAGLSRVPKIDARGMTGLVTTSAAKTSADQRAGRAGRLGPGTVIRAYSEADYQHFQEDITPEILTSDVTGAVLTILAWGSPDLPLLDAPPMERALETLEALGAVKDGRITELGKRLARLPLDPRLGAALLKLGSGAAKTIARLADQDQRRLEKLTFKSGHVPDGQVIAAAYPQWIAKNVGDEYLLASGTRAKYSGHSEWIAAAEVQLLKSGAVIREAAPIDFPEEYVREYTTAQLIDGKVRGRSIKAVGAIELSSTPIKLDFATALEALQDFQFSDFVLDDEAKALKNRLDFLHSVDPSFPDVQQGDYSVELAELAKGKSVQSLNMRAALQRQVPWHALQLVPERICGGKVDYSGEKPVVKLKLQKAFEITETPEILGVKVLFHLLSPAGRPLAVTDDLQSFWAGPYLDVRKQMRGRYPKHHWPEHIGNK